MKDLVFEIGAEEIPASYIRPALEQMRVQAEGFFQEARLSHHGVRVEGTPRRLALLVKGLQERQDDRSEEVQGPSAKAAYAPDGKPTGVAEGFAKGKGVEVGKLVVKATPKGDYVFAKVFLAGKQTPELLEEWLPGLVRKLAFPKSMRWGEGGPLRFARPIQWLLGLYGAKALKLRLEGVPAGSRTYGHRFLAPRPLALKEAGEYEKKLKAAQVVLGFEQRCEMLRRGLAKAAKKHGSLVEDDELLENVANLLEKPVVLEGGFDPAYLVLPAPVIIKVLREHQFCFAVEKKKGDLAPVFLATTNGIEKNLPEIREGNARVIRARLEDAKFFFAEDQKRTLESRLEDLKAVVWQEKLGSMYERVERIGALAGWLADKADPGAKEAALRAARLCKCDLVTLMVGEKEFTSLQGVMGGFYAHHGGETPEVAQAITEHYWPRFAKDLTPTTVPGALLALADKADELVGIFGIGLLPTGSQDPYALRRKAQGITAIVATLPKDVSLRELVEKAVSLYGAKLTTPAGQLMAQVMDFLRGRLENMLQDAGYDQDLVEAVCASRSDVVREAFARAKALKKLRDRDDFELATQAFSRVTNILSKAGEIRAVDPALLEDGSEKLLYERYLAARPVVERHAAAGQYEQAFAALADLRPAIDAYFNDVLVMAEDPALKANRLSFLSQIATTISLIADFRELAKR